MALGGFSQGLAKGIGDELNSQDDRAFKLKLMNAQIEGQMRADEVKYERESRLSPSVTDAAGKFLGMDLSGAAVKDQPTINALINEKSDKASLRMSMAGAVGQRPVYDEGTGIMTATESYNANGVSLKRFPAVGSKEKIAMHGEIGQLLQNLEHADSLYQNLTVQGGGLAGSGLNKLANITGGSLGLSDRNELQKLNRSVSILQGKFADKVPGGRASLGLGERSEAYMINAQNKGLINKNIKDNLSFQAYKALREMGPSTKIDGALLAKFGGLPHDQNNVPINVRWYNGNAYLPGDTKNERPLKLTTPLTPEKADQLRQEGAAREAAANPFNDEAAFQRAVEAAMSRGR